MTFELPSEGSHLTTNDLRRLTRTLIDEVRGLLRHVVDADVVFAPVDPLAHDPMSAGAEEDNLPWTLAHILAHMTASSEEAAAVAQELARGVEYHGRSRYEAPWRDITTVAQCYARLEESRGMRLASLGMWPKDPHLDNTYVPWEGAPPVDATARFVFGLRHDAAHLDQIRDVVLQAWTARQQRSRLGRLRLRWRAQLASEAAQAGAAEILRSNAGLV